MSGDDQLASLRRFTHELRETGKYVGMKTQFRFLQTYERWRIPVAEDGQQGKVAQRTVR